MTNLALSYNRAASVVSKRKVTPSAQRTVHLPDRIGLTSPLAPTPRCRDLLPYESPVHALIVFCQW